MKDFNLKGLITIKDIEKQIKYPLSAKDAQGRLFMWRCSWYYRKRVWQRVDALVNAHVDVIVVDSAHGHSANVLRTSRYGQIANSRICRLSQETLQQETAAEALIKAGADAVKVGIGPGSICTTRVVAGIGVPQITAVMRLL